ncbi:MAG: CopD family protein [Chloroflexi bacterium]|nr:MAG: CopD family protein [Chloroflexota bacterium]
MLPIHSPQIVLWIHILAASVWIGGQVTIAAVIPLLRGADGLAAAAGRRYQVVAWPAFAALAVTGVINTSNAGIAWSDLGGTSTGRTLAAKLGLVALSGAAAAMHAFLQAPALRRRKASTPRPAASALLGLLSVTAAILAALLGVVIRGT